MYTGNLFLLAIRFDHFTFLGFLNLIIFYFGAHDGAKLYELSIVCWVIATCFDRYCVPSIQSYQMFICLSFVSVQWCIYFIFVFVSFVSFLWLTQSVEFTILPDLFHFTGGFGEWSQLAVNTLAKSSWFVLTSMECRLYSVARCYVSWRMLL